MNPRGLLIAVSLVACAADPRASDPRDPGAPSSHPSPTMSGVTLTATAPRQSVAIAAQPAASTTVVVAIAAIDNPSRQPFSLAVSVAWSGDGTTTDEPIGTVTPYPSTRPGSFTLGIPEGARTWLARTDGQLSLQVALTPIDPARPLVDPLRVTLGDATWR